MQEIETQLELVGSNWVLLTTKCSDPVFQNRGGGQARPFFIFVHVSKQ